MDEDVLVIKERVLERIDISDEIKDSIVLSLIQEEVSRLAKAKPISFTQRKTIERRVFNGIRGLDVLEELLSDETITEIMINGPQNIFIERDGKIERSSMAFSSSEKLNDVIQRIAAENNKIVNETNPIIDTRLKDGSRVNMVLQPAAVDSSVISIRKFPKEPMTIKRLLEYKALSQELADFLRVLVVSGYNIFISGGTGSGKTSFLNALSGYIPEDERIITIEDSAELSLNNITNLVRLEARSANLEGKNEITIRDLLKTSLRMRPDRIIVGECRGAEALETLQAFNTGHDGSLSTGHANSAEDMISRLATMVLMGADLPLAAIYQQIAAGVDIIVHLGRLRDKSRKLLSISEVIGIESGQVKLNTLYSFKETGYQAGKIIGTWEKSGELMNISKLERSGMFLKE